MLFVVGSTWQGAATFYPGETITYLLENGTEVHDNWLALYNSPGPTGPLQTGGDFYNFFVLGLYPASFVNNASTTGTAGRRLGIDTSNLTSWNSISPAYPAAANVVQPDLSIEGAGFLTGYFFHDISTAVLSIPSFAESAGNDAAFSSTTQRFIQKAKAAGLSRVVIDLQQNGGGDVELAFDTFGQFFPTTTPFAGSRMRAQPLANALGDALTPFWDNNIAGDPYLYYSVRNLKGISIFRHSLTPLFDSLQQTNGSSPIASMLRLEPTSHPGMSSTALGRTMETTSLSLSSTTSRALSSTLRHLTTSYQMERRPFSYLTTQYHRGIQATLSSLLMASARQPALYL